MKGRFVLAVLALGLWGLTAPRADATLPAEYGWFKNAAAPACLTIDCVADTAAAAYSFTKLRAAYAGNCMTIRRASDNTTQAIGFSGNNCDQSAASTFCTATSCFIATWNDQSGNGADLTQTTTANQPPLKFSCKNGLMCAGQWNGSTQQMAATLASPVGSATFSYVANTASLGSEGVMTLTATPVRSAMFSGTETCDRGTGPTQATAIPTSAVEVDFCTITASLSHLVVNGSAGTDATGSLTPTPTTALVVGSLGGAFFWQNDIEEVIVWLTNISDTDAKTVCRSQASNWAVTTSC